MARKKYSEVEAQLMKDISRNLKDVLNRKGVSQKELADKTELATSTISDYINARTLISPGNLQKISDALNVYKSDIDSSLGGIKFNSIEINNLEDYLFTKNGNKIDKETMERIKKSINAFLD